MAKKYLYQGRVATVEESAEQEFLRQYKGAKLAKQYEYQGKKATVAIDHEQSFLKQYKGAVEVGTPATAKPQTATQPKLDLTRKQEGYTTYQDRAQGFGEFYAGVKGGDAAKIEKSQTKSVDLTAYKDKQIDDNIRAPQRHAEFEQAQDVYKAETKLNEYQSEMRNLIAKDDWTKEEGDRYVYLSDMSHFYKNTVIPKRQTGMSADARAMYDWGRKLADKSPAGSYLMSFATGAASLISGPVNMFNPEGNLGEGLKGMQAGLMGNPDDVIGNMVKSTLYSLPMSIATMVAPPVGAALTQSMLTADLFSDYAADGTLTQREALTGAISGGVQSLIEYGMSMSELGSIKRLFATGGAQAVRSSVLKTVQKSFFPLMRNLPGTMAKVGIQEGIEEAEQYVSDILIRNAVNGDPLPNPEEFGKQLLMNVAGGIFGGMILGGGGATIGIVQNRNAMARLESLSETYDSAKLAVSAINEINSGKAKKAQETIKQAKAEMIGKSVAQPDIQKAVALVDDALNMYYVGEVQAMRAENSQLYKEQDKLVKEQAQLEKSEKNPERLAEVSRLIESNERVIRKNSIEIEKDDTLRKIDKAITEMLSYESKGKEAKADTKEAEAATLTDTYQRLKNESAKLTPQEATQEVITKQYALTQQLAIAKLKQSPEYKQADPAQRSQMETAKLAEIKATAEAEYKAISEPAAEPETSPTQSEEATGPLSEVDRLQAHKTALAQEHGKALREVSKLRKAITDSEGNLIPGADTKAFNAAKAKLREIEGKQVEVRKQLKVAEKAEKDYTGSKESTRAKTATELNEVPQLSDTVAENALLGMIRSHVQTVTHKGREMSVKFKDGRELVLNRRTGIITLSGGRVAIGQTRAEGNVRVIVDLVDGYNQGNRTLFHEAFHTVWKLFLNNEQRAYIKQYYTAQGKAGKLISKYVTKNGVEVPLYVSSAEFNALTPEAREIKLEEGGAYGFEHWLGHRTDTAPNTMLGKLWQRLADAIRHWFVARGMAGKNAKLTDIFHAIASDKLTGEGDMSGGVKSKLTSSTEDYRSPYRWYLTPFRGEITKNKILTRLKDNHAPMGRIKLFEEIRKFDNAEEFGNHIYYHGTTNWLGKGLQPSIVFSDRFIEQNGGGGYGQKYWSISLSKSKNIASNFSGMEQTVTVYPVLLRKGAKVVEMPQIQDAADIEDVIVELWQQGVDAVLIGDQEGGEQELSVLNPKAIYTFDHPDTYRAFKKERLHNLTPDRIAEIYDIAHTRGVDIARTKELPKQDRNEAIRKLTQDIRFKELTQSEAERQYAEVEAKYRGTDAWMKAPNGKPTNLNERQWVQVRTKAFKDWFGDWENDPANASKVLDENGEPRVVYHGTKSRRPINIFRTPSDYGETYFAQTEQEVYRYSTINKEGAEYLVKQNAIMRPALIRLADKYLKPIADIPYNPNTYSHMSKFDREAQNLYWEMVSPNNIPSGVVMNQRLVELGDSPIYDYENIGQWGYFGYGETVNGYLNYLGYIEAEMEDRESEITEQDNADIVLVKNTIASIKEQSGIMDNPTVVKAFVNIRNPIHDSLQMVRGYDSIVPLLQNAKEKNADGILLTTGSDLGAKNVIIVMNNNNIKSATANVGTFDSTNPDIRYRPLTEAVPERMVMTERRKRATAMWRAVYGAEATDTATPAETPKPTAKVLPQRTVQTEPPTKDEIKELSRHIGKELGISSAQVTEKLGRQMLAAWREAEGEVSRLMESAAIRNFQNWIEHNKPEGTNKQDLTWHWDEMLEHARKVGLSRETIAEMVKQDRFDPTAIGLNLFQRMNYLGKILLRTEETLKDRNWGTPAEREQMETQYSLALGQFDECQEAYARQGSMAGTVLWTRKQNKAEYLETLTQAGNAIESRLTRDSDELTMLKAELTEAERMLVNLEKSFEALLGVMGETRFKEYGDMTDTERQAERARLAASIDDLKRRIDGLNYAVSQKVASMQAGEARRAEVHAQMKKAAQSGHKAKVIDITPRKPDLYDWWKTIWYNNILSSPMTHAVNVGMTSFNSTMEDFITTLLNPKAGIAALSAKTSNLKGGLGAAKTEFLHPSTFNEKNQIVKTSNKLYNFLQTNTRLMSAEDMFFYHINHAGHLKSLAVVEAKRTGRSVEDLYANPTAEMLRQSEYESMRDCFNQNPEGFVGLVVNAIQKTYYELEANGKLGKAGAGLLRFSIMPFTRIVGNVFNATLDYTPLGLIRLAEYASKSPDSLVNKQRKGRDGKALWADGTGDRVVSPYRTRDMARQATRVAIGTVLGSLLYALVMSLKSDDDKDWIISGSGYRDYNQQKQLMLTGWRPYSLHIGDAVISYNEWPIAGFLSIVGNLHDYEKYQGKNKPQDWADKTTFALMGIAKSFMQRSFLSGVSGVIMAINNNDPKWLKRTGANAVTSLINNNFFRLINNIYDRNVYQPETITQQMLSGVPLLPKGSLPKRINVFGEADRRDYPWSRLFGTPAGLDATIPDEGRTREIFAKLREQGQRLSVTTTQELRVDKAERNAPEEERLYLSMKGKDRERFMILRGEEYVRLLNENYNTINSLIASGEKDELKALLTSLGTASTKEAKRQMLVEYDRGLLKHQYKTYNKSKEQSE